MSIDMWNRRNLLFVLVVLIPLLGYGCLVQKSTEVDTQEKPLITWQKTGCLGKCPTFTLFVYESGRVLFDPTKHTLIDTISEYVISDQRLSELREVFDDRFPKLDTSYVSQIMDAPFTYLSYRTGEIVKKISQRGAAPASFQLLVDQLERLAAEANWLPRKTDDGREMIEIIIELLPEATPQALIETLPKYKPVLIKQITPSGRYYLFSIASDDPQQDLLEIQSNPLVKNAQWNHKLKKRDN